jgi:hypothetical protein
MLGRSDFLSANAIFTSEAARANVAQNTETITPANSTDTRQYGRTSFIEYILRYYVTVDGNFERIEQRTQCQNAGFRFDQIQITMLLMNYSIFKVVCQYLSKQSPGLSHEMGLITVKKVDKNRKLLK